MEKLRTQLSDMRARCERVEKEKAEILLRKLSTMDSVSSKVSSTDVLKLQKTVKDLQAKNDGNRPAFTEVYLLSHCFPPSSNLLMR